MNIVYNSENYAILAASLMDLPLRQRSIHTVLDTSWRLLDPVERLVLARCAIFRGAFSSEAAFTVADAAPAPLERLEAKSLLRLTNLGRYEMHELVRQYAADQLAQRDVRIGAQIRRYEETPLLVALERARPREEEAHDRTRLRLRERQRPQFCRELLPSLLTVEEEALVEPFRDDKGNAELLAEISRKDDAAFRVKAEDSFAALL